MLGSTDLRMEVLEGDPLMALCEAHSEFSAQHPMTPVPSRLNGARAQLDRPLCWSADWTCRQCPAGSQTPAISCGSCPIKPDDSSVS